jgi:hypothetical protein
MRFRRNFRGALDAPGKVELIASFHFCAAAPVSFHLTVLLTRTELQIQHQMPLLSDLEAFLFLAKKVKIRYNQGARAVLLLFKGVSSHGPFAAFFA